MSGKPCILAINGSASKDSSCLRILQHLAVQLNTEFTIELVERLSHLPHFDPELSIDNTPPVIAELREKIGLASGVIICTPEYVFSIPSGLKNLIEWCVSTTVFAQKPSALITASAHGKMGHDELQLILRTVEARFTDRTALLIQGVKAKVGRDGGITDQATLDQLNRLGSAFAELVHSAAGNQ